MKNQFKKLYNKTGSKISKDIDPNTAQIILYLKKEIRDLKYQLFTLKKEKQETERENLLLKKEIQERNQQFVD